MVRISEECGQKRTSSGERAGRGARRSFPRLMGIAFAAIVSACVQRPGPSVEGVTTASREPVATATTGKSDEVSGVSLLGPQGLRALTVSGHTERVAVSHVPVSGQPFTEALRAEIKDGSTNVWDVQVSARTVAPVEAGDVLLATFFFRTERSRAESGEGQTEFVFELARDPWTKSVSYPVRAGRDWKQYHVPFVAVESYAPGEAQMIFRLGYDPQIIEIGGVTVENFGKRLRLADLPVTKLTYPGMEPDAPWRAQAAQRIEQHRKGDLTIEVRDAAGRPVPDAEVSAKQVRHAFGFGTCAPASLVLGENEKFQANLRELFNMVTLENDLKWQALTDWGSGFTLERAQAAVDSLRKNGFAVRGHVLVWPSFKNSPKYLRELEKDPAKLRAEVIEHIRKLTRAMRGKLVHWDVVNEPFDNHDFMDILGQDVLAEFFKEARAGDPGAKLFINDYAILSGGGGWSAHREHYETTIRRLLELGAPLDAIGMQGHFGTALTGPEELLAILDRYAKLGKPIHVTEYDVVIDDEEVAGKYTHDFYTTLFSHPQVESITMWGFWDGSHWKQNAPLFRTDWSIKPAGEAYRKLVLETFRTDVQGKTDARGAFATRGFFGEYEIVVRASGKEQRVRHRLEPGKGLVKVGLR